jgi:hypothetical protein
MSDMSDMSVCVTITRSAGPDGAVLVLIDTERFKPNKNNGDPGLRVLVNDANVTECEPTDFVAYRSDEQERSAPSAVLTAELADLAVGLERSVNSFEGPAALRLGELSGDLSAPTPVSMLVPGVDGGTVHTVTGRAHSALRVRLIRAHSQFTQDGVRTVVYSDMAFYYATGQSFDQAESQTLERAKALRYVLVDRCVSGAGVALTFVTPE